MSSSVNEIFKSNVKNLWRLFCIVYIYLHYICIYFKSKCYELTSHSRHLNTQFLLVVIALKSVGFMENSSQRLASALENKAEWKKATQGENDKRWSTFNFPFCGAGSLTPRALWQLLSLETFHYRSIYELLWESDFILYVYVLYSFFLSLLP